MHGLPAFSSVSAAESRATKLAELRLLLSRDQGLQGWQEGWQGGWQQGLHAKLPFGVGALDSHLPNGGLPCGALHEIVPAREAALPAAFGFVIAVLARFRSTFPGTATK